MLLLRPDKDLLVLGAIRRGHSRFGAIKKASGIADGELDRLLKRLQKQGLLVLKVAETVGQRTFVDYRVTRPGEQHAKAAAMGISVYAESMRAAGLDPSELARYQLLLSAGA